VQAAFDLQNQNILTPAIFERGAQIPISRGTVLNPIENPQIVAPGQFGNELLQNLWLRPRLRQSTHIPEIPRAEAFDTGELSLQVTR
jgi:hypothetical protein